MMINMKVVSCKNCGAKYQLDDDDDIRDYECSVCTGNLEFLESYPATSSEKSVSVPKDELNDSELVYCTNCGLKHRLNPDDNINDFECSSCYGKLRYANEELNQELDKSKIDDNTTDKLDTANIETYDTPTEKNLRSSLKEEFLHNVDNEFPEEKKGFLKKLSHKNKEDSDKTSPENKDDSNKTSQDKDNITKESQIEDEDSSEMKKKTEIEPSTSEEVEDTPREVVLNPKIKGRSYHDFFIEIGLIIALIGIIDMVLTNSQRGVFDIAIIAIGFILFVIGLIYNKKHRDSKEREKLVREKLLSLPKEFYVLSYLKLPNAKSQIDHVVVGPTGIFTILTQKYKSKNSKKHSLAIATYSSFKKTDMNTNRDTILNFNKKEKKFEDNDKIKQKSIKLTKNLIEYLDENDFNRFYIEPLTCFINKKVAIINIVLTDEDLFLEELLTRISHEKTILDYTTLNKCATLLSEYSAESA